MKYNPSAHRDRRTGIHIWLLIIPLLAALLCAFNSCSPSRGGGAAIRPET